MQPRLVGMPVSGAAGRWLAAAALVALTLAAYARFLDTGFAATDSLPLIETSRLTSLADVPLQFTRPVMAGTRFALGEVVYRPFVSVTFGIDYALWGLQAAGYHLTNLAIHVMAVLCVWLLLMQLGLRWWSSLGGAAIVAVHPVVVASVPVIARRDSVVPMAFFTAATALLLVAEQGSGSKRAFAFLGSIACVAIALLSKESAFAALAMLPVVLFTANVGDGAGVRQALARTRIVVPLFALAAIIFCIRFGVLHGLGGAADDSDLLNVDLDKYGQILGAYTRDLVWPFAWIAPSTREIWQRLALAILAFVVLAVALLPRRYAALMGAGMLWIAGFAVFCMLLKIGTIAWLAYFALVGVSLLVAAGFEGAVRRLRAPLGLSGSRLIVARVGSTVLLVALGIFAATSLAASALFRDYYQWHVAGEVTHRYMQALSTCVAAAPQAHQVNLHNLPSSLDDGVVDTSLLGVTLLEDYTVESGLRLYFPQRDLTVNVSSWGTLRKGADSLRFSCSGSGNVVQLTTDYS